MSSPNHGDESFGLKEFKEFMVYEFNKMKLEMSNFKKEVADTIELQNTGPRSNPNRGRKGPSSPDDFRKEDFEDRHKQ